MALSSVVSRYSMSKNIVTLKSWSVVNQGRWKCYYSIEWVLFRISVCSTAILSLRQYLRHSTCNFLYSDLETRGHSSYRNRQGSIRRLWLPKLAFYSNLYLSLYWTVLKIMDAGYCLYVHIFIFFSHLNRLILTTLINSCQTSGSGYYLSYDIFLW